MYKFRQIIRLLYLISGRNESPPPRSLLDSYIICAYVCGHAVFANNVAMVGAIEPQSNRFSNCCFQCAITTQRYVFRYFIL
jgi:hypothetical protein